MAIQFRVDDCILKYSEDGGNTWLIAANLSQCSSPSSFGPEARCSVAAFLADNLRMMQDEIISGWQTNLDRLEVAGAILGVIGTVGAFFTGGASLLIASAVGVVFSAFAQIAGLDANSYDDALSSDFYEYVKCKLYCILSNDGRFNSRILQEWITEVRAYNTANPAYAVVADYIAGLTLETWTDLARVAAIRQYPGDCSLCTCIPECQLYGTNAVGQRVALTQNSDGTYTLQSSQQAQNFYWAVVGLAYSNRCCKILEVIPEGAFSYPPAFSTDVFASIVDCERNVKLYKYPQTLSAMSNKRVVVKEQITG